MGPWFVITGAMVPLMKMGALADIGNATRSTIRLFEMLDRMPAVESSSNQGLTPAACRGEIEVQNVVFAYPTAPDHMICKGLSLSIPAGKTMALCGGSGSGKSTLIQLLERFYDPLGGLVMLNGVDIKSLNVRWLRSQLGLVGQEPVLFQGTVVQNIAYGKPTPATQEEIEIAARTPLYHPQSAEWLCYSGWAHWWQAFRGPKAACCHSACTHQEPCDSAAGRGDIGARQQV